jgi:hypothetical protein
MAIPATMEDQIAEVKDLEISYRNLHPGIYLTSKNENDKIRIPYSSVTNKYKDYLSNIIIDADLTEDELLMYRFNPKRLSEDIYGTTQLWNDILIINNCVSVRQFDLDRVKIYDPEEFKSYLNEIMIIEKELGNIDY